MTDPITVGSILIEEGVRLPAALQLQRESHSNGWAAVKDTRSTFDTATHEAGLTFFFMAGEIEATVFGFDKQKALRVALKRLITDAESQHCNSMEITRITDKSFLRFPYVSVSAHARHLQKGNLFSG
jgi:hypothetical protein